MEEERWQKEKRIKEAVKDRFEELTALGGVSAECLAYVRQLEAELTRLEQNYQDLLDR